MNNFDEIWFDMDGTLAIGGEEYKKIHDELSYKVYAKSVNKPLSTEVKKDYDDLIKKHKSNSAVFRSLGHPSGYWTDHIEAVGLADTYQPREDVVDVLQELSKRARLGLFTNNKTAMVHKILARINVSPTLFHKMVTGDEVKERKPHPHGFELMLERANCPADKLLYLGDRYHVDVEPAQKLGIKAGIVWTEDKRADYSFPEFTDLLKLNRD